jgi:hypothetical protein
MSLRSSRLQHTSEFLFFISLQVLWKVTVLLCSEFEISISRFLEVIFFFVCFPYQSAQCVCGRCTTWGGALPLYTTSLSSYSWARLLSCSDGVGGGRVVFAAKASRPMREEVQASASIHRQAGLQLPHLVYLHVFVCDSSLPNHPLFLGLMYLCRLDSSVTWRVSFIGTTSTSSACFLLVLSPHPMPSGFYRYATPSGVPPLGAALDGGRRWILDVRRKVSPPVRCEIVVSCEALACVPFTTLSPHSVEWTSDGGCHRSGVATRGSVEVHDHG